MMTQNKFNSVDMFVIQDIVFNFLVFSYFALF